MIAQSELLAALFVSTVFTGFALGFTTAGVIAAVIFGRLERGIARSLARPIRKEETT